METITKYYAILGIDKSATKEEIKKAFHKLAHIHHPDKGGDEQKFKEINNAYNILMKDSYWHILADMRRYERNYEQEYSEHDRNTGKKQHRGTSDSKSYTPKYVIYCNDEGTKFWTEDADGYVKSFYGEPEPMEEEVYK